MSTAQKIDLTELVIERPDPENGKDEAAKDPVAPSNLRTCANADAIKALGWR
jgi:hypothetical protein